MWQTLKGIVTSDPITRMGLLTGLMIVLIQWVGVIIWAWRLPPEIPLYYSLPVGQMQLVNRLWFFLLPTLSLIFFLTNVGVVGLSGNLNKVFPQVTTWLTNVSLFLMLLAMTHSVMMAL